MEWELRDLSLQCALCGRSFHDLEVIISAVVDRGDHFERLDYCEGCHHDLDSTTVYARWRTEIPPKDPPSARQSINEKAVREFFVKLGGEEEPLKRNFRYVLALMLLRRKALKFGGVRRGEGGEKLLLLDPRTGEQHAVYNPQLGEVEILALTEEVGKVMNVRVPPPPEKAPDA